MLYNICNFNFFVLKLLWRLLSTVQQHDYSLQNIEILLDSEIAWLKNVKVIVMLIFLCVFFKELNF